MTKDDTPSGPKTIRVHCNYAWEAEPIVAKAVKDAGHTIDFRDLHYTSTSRGVIYKHPKTGQVIVRKPTNTRFEVFTPLDNVFARIEAGQEESVDAKINISFGNLKRATSGELESVLRDALKRAGYKGTLGQLHKINTRDGLVYQHPDTQERVIASSYNHKNGQTTYDVYYPDGYIASRIKLESARAKGIAEALPCVVEIKDFGQFTAKQKNDHRLLGGRSHKKSANRDREITLARNAAREAKALMGMGPLGGKEIAETSAAVSNEVEVDQAPSTKKYIRLAGPIARERSYTLPVLESTYDPVPHHKLTLKARMNKEIAQHPDGYTATQYNKAGRCVTRYNPAGKRLEQTTYDWNGEVVKSEGPQGVEPTLPKPNRPKPSDKQAARIARKRLHWQEDMDHREHIAVGDIVLTEDEEIPVAEPTVTPDEIMGTWRSESAVTATLKGGLGDTHVEKLKLREKATAKEDPTPALTK